MPQGTAVDGSWESAARWAFLHALDVLDPRPDAALDAIAEMLAGPEQSPAGVYLRDGLTMLLAAGRRSPAGSDSFRAPILLDGLEVGEVRSASGGDVLARAAETAASVLAKRLQKLQFDADGDPVAVVVVDAEGTIVWVSNAIEEVLGYSASESLGVSILKFVDPDILEAATGVLRRVLSAPGRATWMPVSMTTHEGGARTVDVLSNNRVDDPVARSLSFVLRMPKDLAGERSVLGDQLWVLNRLSYSASLEEVLARVIDLVERRDHNSSACVMGSNDTGTALTPLLAPGLPAAVIEALSPIQVGPDSPAGGATAFHHVPRFTADIFRDESWKDLREPLTAAGYRACWSAPIAASNGRVAHGSLDIYRRVAGSPTEVEGQLLTVAALLASVAFDHEAQTRGLRFRATHDPLTDLPNRAYFAERLDDHAAGNLGVLFVDLDRFKLVNDTLGHEFGDELLCAVAGRLAGAITEPAVVARFGGDEFTILLPDANTLGDVVDKGHQLLAILSEPYEIRGQTVTIGASAGATFSEGGHPTPAEAQALVRDADAALYHAKERGRGRVEAFDDRLLTAIADRVWVEKTLREALGTPRVWAEFQPEVRVCDGAVVGAEALARCCTPSGRQISPSTFIPVAEEAGLIPRLFETVLVEACLASTQLNAGRSQPEPFVTWVNLSAQQLGSRDLGDQIRRVIAMTGALAPTLGFEVTERGILPDPVEAVLRLRELAELGCRLAVDDFGTGYSSLGYLQELPVDTVKLDQSFVVKAAYDTRSRAIVSAVVDLAVAMGLTCVAEGVETAAQLEVVSSLGCKVVQGYVYARPQRISDLSAWLAARSIE